MFHRRAFLLFTCPRFVKLPPPRYPESRGRIQIAISLKLLTNSLHRNLWEKLLSKVNNYLVLFWRRSWKYEWRTLDSKIILKPSRGGGGGAEEEGHDFCPINELRREMKILFLLFFVVTSCGLLLHPSSPFCMSQSDLIIAYGNLF